MYVLIALLIQIYIVFDYWLSIIPLDTKKTKKASEKFVYSLINRVAGFLLLLAFSISVFVDTPLVNVVNKRDSLIHIAENIIVYGDYRPDNYISECTNIEQGDWGLLAGYQKISVAHPEKSGGYSFTTKRCLFD